MPQIFRPKNVYSIFCPFRGDVRKGHFLLSFQPSKTKVHAAAVAAAKATQVTKQSKCVLLVQSGRSHHNGTTLSISLLPS